MNRSGWIFIAALLFLSAMSAVFWVQAHPPWREWQSRYNEQPGVEALRAQIRVITPARSGSPELCLTCHVGIEDISASHPAQVFGCVVCHGGEAMALDKDRAHAAMRGGRNPSDLTAAGLSCGQADCHGGYDEEERNHVDRVSKSIQATYAGGIAHTRFAFGAQRTPEAGLGLYAVADAVRPLPSKALAAIELFAADASPIDSKIMACLNGGCHLREPPGKPQPYLYRSSGCAACHYLYANDGLYRGTDATIPRDRAGHGIVHSFTTAVPFTQCNHCHNRGNYSLKGMEFEWREDLPPVRRPLSARIGAEGRRRIEYYQPIGEFTRCEYELDCIDCHTSQEAMGNGHIYGSKKDVRYIECRTCHGTPDAKPRTAMIRDQDELAMRRARISGHEDYLKIGDRVIETDQGELLWSIKEIAPDRFLQIGKVSGKSYSVPLVMGSPCRQNGGTQTSDYCHLCHSEQDRK